LIDYQNVKLYYRFRVPPQMTASFESKFSIIVRFCWVPWQKADITYIF